MVGVSADADSDSTPSEEIPEIGVRSRKQYSRSIHRPDPDADTLQPACREQLKDVQFKKCDPGTLRLFSGWKLCEHPECFGDRDSGVEQENGVTNDSSQCADGIDCSNGGEE